MLPPTGIARATDGRDLAFCEWGSPTGSPVFYLHGTPGGRYFRHTGGEYDRIRMRVITFDRPGYGRSTRHPVGLSRTAPAMSPQSQTTLAWTCSPSWGLPAAGLMPSRPQQPCTIG